MMTSKEQTRAHTLYKKKKKAEVRGLSTTEKEHKELDKRAERAEHKKKTSASYRVRELVNEYKPRAMTT